MSLQHNDLPQGYKQWYHCNSSRCFTRSKFYYNTISDITRIQAVVSQEYDQLYHMNTGVFIDRIQIVVKLEQEPG